MFTVYVVDRWRDSHSMVKTVVTGRNRSEQTVQIKIWARLFKTNDVVS